MIRSALIAVAAIGALSLFGGAVSPAPAQIYVWTDENGVPHFSNVLPSEEAEESGEKLRELPHDPEAAARREAAREEDAFRRERERLERERERLAEAVRRAEAAAREAERSAEEIRSSASSPETDPEDDDRVRYRVPVGGYGYPPVFGRSRGNPVLGLNPLPEPEEADDAVRERRGRKRRDRRHPGERRPCPRRPVPILP